MKIIETLIIYQPIILGILGAISIIAAIGFIIGFWLLIRG